MCVPSRRNGSPRPQPLASRSVRSASRQPTQKSAPSRPVANVPRGRRARRGRPSRARASANWTARARTTPRASKTRARAGAAKAYRKRNRSRASHDSINRIAGGLAAPAGGRQRLPPVAVVVRAKRGMEVRVRPRRGVTLAEQLAASSNLRDLLKLRDGDGLFASIYLGAEQSLARINPSQLFHFLFAHKSKLRLFVSAELPFFSCQGSNDLPLCADVFHTIQLS